MVKLIKDHEGDHFSVCSRNLVLQVTTFKEPYDGICLSIHGPVFYFLTDKTEHRHTVINVFLTGNYS